MAYILSRTISAAVDKKIVLENDTLTRALNIGTTWNAVRIGMRFAVDSSLAASTMNGKLFYFGMCAGTVNTVGAATTDNFIGVRSIDSNAYNAGPPPYFGAMTLFNTTRSGTTDVPSTLMLASLFPATGTVRNAIITEITRGSPNYSVALVASNSAQQTDLGLPALLAAMEASTMANAAIALGGGAAYTSAIQATPFTIAAGNPNAVTVGWNLHSKPLEISEIVYARIS